MKRVTGAFICAATAAAFLLSAAPAAAQDLCPYDASGDYTYDANRTPTYLFFGDGQITYDGSIPWYMDDVNACYNTYKTPGYGIYFPKCDLDGNGSVSIGEVYDIYYRVHPVNQTDEDVQKICSQMFRTGPFYFCHPSRYNRIRTDRDAIVANYPAAGAIFDGVSGSLGQSTLQWEYKQLRCSTPGAFNPAAFDALNECYLGTTTCEGQPCQVATIDFSQNVDPYLTEMEYSDVAQNFGGICERVATEHQVPQKVPGIYSYKYASDGNYWIYNVRATAQCVGDACACEQRYELYTHKNYPGNVYLMNETNLSTTACTDARFPAGTGCPDADYDGVCDANDPCPNDNPDDPDGNGVCGDQGTVGPQTAIENGDVLEGEADNYSYDVVAGSDFSTYLAIQGGSARVFVQWGHAPTSDDNVCQRFVSAGYEWGCDLVVPAGETKAYVMVDGVAAGTSNYTLTVTYTRPGAGCPDADSDLVCDADDQCPGEDDLLNTDGDAVVDCLEECDNDPNKSAPGVCGCGEADIDNDGDNVYTCQGDQCDNDPAKTVPGQCGCGTADTDSDSDGVADCIDGCDYDPYKTTPGQCGCGNPDTDTDGDSVADCADPCPNDNPDDPDGDGQCGWAPADPTCDDLAGTDWGSCPPRPLGAAVINGDCQMIFGCEVPAGIALWANVTECLANCRGCIDNSFCDTSEYCKYDDYTCGPVGTGSCVPRGDVCSAIYDPVCACDFTIVSNPCQATVQGKSIMADGECAQEDVCNYNGGSWNGTDCDCPAGTRYSYQTGCIPCAGDADGDGVCDFEDVCPGEDDTIDTDGDGTPDCDDPCPNDPNPSCTPDPCAGIGDTDGDGVCDDVDNCVDDYNPGQQDNDGDGVGDACESCTDGTPTLHSYDVGGPSTFGEPGEFTELDGLLYFRARVDGYGEELMAYDPLADDTFLVADIYPGAGGGSPYFLTAHEGKLYFRAMDDSFDNELYVYDPVADQVDKIDVDPAGGSNPKELYSASDGLLYFNARENGDIELYTYNPAGGQVARYEVYPGTDQYGNPNQGVPKEFLEYNGKIYLQADGTEGKELHSFDMTTKQFQRLANIATGYSNGRGRSSSPTELTLFNNEIFFNAAKDASLDQELWIYTPATGGMREIEIDPSQNLFGGTLVAAGSGPTLFTPYNGKLYMRAQQVPVGIELFVYDPAIDDVYLVWDSAPGQYENGGLTYGNDGNTAYLTLLNDVLYFSAPFDNRELWYYDPVADDGGQLMEIYPGVDQWGNPNHGDPHGITAFNDRLFFRASDPNYDLELFSVSWECP